MALGISGVQIGSHSTETYGVKAAKTKGAIVPSTGKVIVGITSSTAKPELVRGKIVDRDAAKVARKRSCGLDGKPDA